MNPLATLSLVAFLSASAAHAQASESIVTASFADYLLPSAMDLPSFITDTTCTPSTTHPLGTKGVGEAGAIASTPAIINGVVDALRPLGVTDINMPAAPMTVWRAIQAAKAGGAA